MCVLSPGTKCVGLGSNASGGVLVWNLVQTSSVLTELVMVLCSSFTALLTLYIRLDFD